MYNAFEGFQFFIYHNDLYVCRFPRARAGLKQNGAFAKVETKERKIRKTSGLIVMNLSSTTNIYNTI